MTTIRKKRSGAANDGDDEYSYPLHMIGTATPLPIDAERDVIAELHAIVEEVTGKPLDRKPRPRIGFLP